MWLIMTKNHSHGSISFGTRRQLRQLRKHMRQFVTLGIKYGTRPLPRCFQFCRTIDKNITICIENHYTDFDILMEYIQEDWKSAMHSHTGLSEYYLQICDKSRKLTRKNRKVKKLLWKADKQIRKLIY